MISIIGLGNPGSRYRKTRHNAGFMVLDRYAHKNGLSFRPGKGKFFFVLLKNTPGKCCL